MSYCNDQFVVDTDSRYPLFSDMSTGEFSRTNKPAREVGSFESKFRSEQYGYPAYYDCRYAPCKTKDSFGVPPVQMGPHLGASGAYSTYPAAPRYRENISAIPDGKISVGDLTFDGNTVVIVFLFLVIIFICCLYGKAISTLQQKIDSLTHILTQ
jgi:hypothetical protein